MIRFTAILILTIGISPQALAGSNVYRLKKTGAGSGKVCVAEDGPNSKCEYDDSTIGTDLGCMFGERFRVIAVPDSNSRFVKWSGDCNDSNRLCELLCGEDGEEKVAEATAHFEPKLEKIVPKKNRATAK